MGADIDDAVIQPIRYSYECNPELAVECEILEIEVEFNKKYAKYKEQLRKYNIWYKENKEAIDEEIKLRQQENIAKKQRAAERDEKRTQKRIKELEKELNKLKGS